MVDDIYAQRRLTKFDGGVGLGLSVAALGLYIFTLAPGVLEADGGEFQFVPWLPGIAHPTGYPLYVLAGWLWTHLLPLGSVAWRMNLLSAVFGALAVGVTYLVACRVVSLALPDTPLAAQRAAAAVTATTLSVTHTYWSQALIAEVYTLHALFVVSMLWLALHAANRPKLLAFTFGLGLTHHLTTILLAPALAVYLWQTCRQLHARQLAACVALFCAPLLLYLYLPIVAPTVPYASLQLSDAQTLTLYDNSLRGFWQHVTATVFTGELQPAAVGVERLRLVWQLLRAQMGWVGAGLGLIGLITLWRQKKFNLLALTAIAFVTFVGFNLVYFIGDVFVLFIPAWLIVCLWLGVGSLALARRLASQFVRRKMGAGQEIAFEQMREHLARRAYQTVVWLLMLFFFALPLVLGVTRFAGVNQQDNTAAETKWRQILAQPIPHRAILVSNDRNEIMPMWYFQYVEGQRPDLLGLFPLITPAPEFSNAGRVFEQALASGRPVYLIKPMDGLSLKANLAPEGVLFRATPFHPADPQNLVGVSLPKISLNLPGKGTVEETILLLGYNVSSTTIQPGGQITVTLYWQPTQPLTSNYTSYVHLLTENNHKISQNDHQPGGNYYPSSYWQVSEVLRDTHTLPIPADAPVDTYRLRIGMYFQPRPGVVVGMGEGVQVSPPDGLQLQPPAKRDHD